MHARINTREYHSKIKSINQFEGSRLVPYSLVHVLDIVISICNCEHSLALVLAKQTQRRAIFISLLCNNTTGAGCHIAQTHGASHK